MSSKALAAGLVLGNPALVYRWLVFCHEPGAVQLGTLVQDFHRMTGNLNELHGLANLDALNTKRQRVLPARCRVYDLLNFASEVATHHTTPEGSQIVQAFIGSLTSDEYDMESTAETVTEFCDFFAKSEDVSAAPSLN